MKLPKMNKRIAALYARREASTTLARRQQVGEKLDELLRARRAHYDICEICGETVGHCGEC